ncbi:DUF1365 domain-containing protein [Endozoicomonas sp. OPT23]|uniref:DUF1365 domain-containing protein n=1 Tax=Endozoicomonas sp. OPT23 TaxID=2072845 RepID=UPI00129AC36A|nr:DUF1365 domain-containing protein [Endozoicomonas sp. OPT23]MRI31850.1 DUF1365 domain-containing protein [Endozoicomonas sp. OPT23]
MNSVLFTGRLMHHRFQPRVHQFSYRVVSWLFDLDELEQLNQNFRLFSRNRFNLFSFFDRDYGDGSDCSLKQRVNQLLEEHQLETAENIRLLCYPRVLGYVFNPLSVYYCFSAEKLTAIVYEVSNTFGERHSYVMAVSESPGNENIDQLADKQMHVSPFFERDCFYRFAAPKPAELLKLSIELFKGEQKLFIAALNGKRKSITDKELLTAFVSIPFQTIKVMVTIHWQALKLWLKGIPLVRHEPLENNHSSSKGKLSPEAITASMET